MRGKLIVLEGLDRAGKSSQCTRLAERLQKDGHKVQHMRFPGQYHGDLTLSTWSSDRYRQDHTHRQADKQLPGRLIRTRRSRNPPPLLSKSLGSRVSIVASQHYYQNSCRLVHQSEQTSSPELLS